MERDPSVFILGEDVGAYGGAFKVTEGFAKQFGEARVIDTPISEAAIVGAAAGAAHMGMRPVAEMQDRKSTRLNSSHTVISYAVFCLKKKNDSTDSITPR